MAPKLGFDVMRRDESDGGIIVGPSLGCSSMAGFLNLMSEIQLLRPPQRVEFKIGEIGQSATAERIGASGEKSSKKIDREAAIIHKLLYLILLPIHLHIPHTREERT